MRLVLHISVRKLPSTAKGPCGRRRAAATHKDRAQAYGCVMKIEKRVTSARSEDLVRPPAAGKTEKQLREPLNSGRKDWARPPAARKARNTVVFQKTETVGRLEWE